MDNILTRSRLTAQAALEAKLEHMAFMSRGMAHDLKNLITPVSSFLVHTDGHFPPDSIAHEVHSTAKRSVKIMNDYVTEALFFAKRLEPRFEPLNVRDVFSAVRDLTAKRAADRRVKLAIPPTDIPFVADSVLLQRVLANLVNNAVDASGSGQTVKLLAERKGDHALRIQVVDEGAGIPPENLGRVFDPYFTTKEFGDSIRGFGLGLTICQKIVHLHSGAISVESQLGHGTTMTVDLPATRAGKPARQEVWQS